MYRGGFREAFKIIMSDFRRAIQLKMGITTSDWNEILEIIQQRRPDLSDDVEKLRYIVDVWNNIIRGRRVKLKPEDYLRMFETIKYIREKL